MKNLIVLLSLFLAACETSRHGEPCVGVMDQKKPGVSYELSTSNVVVGVIFSASLIVPAVVVLKALECPLRPDAPAGK